MAQNVQNVTLSLTLPITCHICLGKVRQPVICVNHHVFCTVCIELWLKNNNQCPVCRVPITPENPCKDIIGGTGENEGPHIPSVRKHLRKTRFDLLQKEYEEEIDSMVKEIAELKAKNVALEEQLKDVALPVTVPLCSECHSGTKQAAEENCIDSRTLVEWNKKLQAANEITRKVTGDIEKIKEENKKLRNENIQFVRENLRLKTEVDSRSPQKFGRFTVAALQAKVDQYEREMNRLKKALERSDQYIEDLEAQVEQLKRPTDQKQKEKSLSENDALTKENVSCEGPGTVFTCQEVKDISPGHRLGDFESTPGIDPHNSIDTSSSSNGHTCNLNKEEYFSEKNSSPKLQKKSCAKLLEDNSVTCDNNIKIPLDKKDSFTPSKNTELHDSSSPGTSLMPFSSLQLNSPDSLARSFNPMDVKKPLTYLRKLMFDDFPKKNGSDSLASAKNDSGPSTNKDTTCFTTSQSVFLHSCQAECESRKTSKEITDQKEVNSHIGKTNANQPRQCLLRRLPIMNDDELNRARTTSESSMDAAFFDKISELDCMMSDLEGSRSPCHTNNTSSLAEKISEHQSAPENKVNQTFEGSQFMQPCSTNPVFSQHTLGIDKHLPCRGLSVAQSQNGDFQKDQSNPSLMFCKLLPQSNNDDDPYQSSLYKIPNKVLDTEAAWTSSCAPRSINNNGPAAKRKLINPSSDSPPKSIKH
ncbi:ORC ubiquitin ligase 1 [Rhinophrynus dorsalis]